VALIVIYVHEEGEKHKIETRYCVGELTGELEEFGSGSFIEEHVSSGPNNYAYSVLTLGSGKRSYKCKVQGITLNYVNPKAINLASQGT
jgi:hypothetical protein